MHEALLIHLKKGKDEAFINFSEKKETPMIPRGVNLCSNEVYIWYDGPSLVRVPSG